MTWLVIGAGVSGYGACELLRKENQKVRVSEGSKLSDSQIEKFRAIGVEVLDGGHKDTHLKGITNIVLSPGILADLPLLRFAQEKGVPFISEIDLALQRFDGELIGVTGTNGKSTTCAMIAHLFTKLGQDVSLGGNFGDPPSSILARGEMKDVLVAELSSYQLDMSYEVKPSVAIFTSFSHDHIARHGTLENYLKAKWKIFSRIKKDGLAILPNYVMRLAHTHQLALPDAQTIVIDPNNLNATLKVDASGQKEKHNLLNAAYATLAVSHITGEEPQKILPLLQGYFGLPHRCQLVGKIKNFPVINDSKSTNVESTLVALESQSQPVVLLMGGKGKEESYRPLIDQKSKILKLYTFGASGKIIHDELKNHVNISENHPTLEKALEAVTRSLKLKPGPVLFSPGCASFDEFKNFEERGDYFREKMSVLFDK